MLPNFHQPKRKGEWAEAAFLLQAARLGFIVSRPWGDSAPYDFIAHRRLLHRVQVKSVWSKKHVFGYCLRTSRGSGPKKGRKPYNRTDFDFLAAYIVPLDLWYIIPMKRLPQRQTIMLYPRGTTRGKPLYEAFRNAWHLLR